MARQVEALGLSRSAASHETEAKQLQAALTAKDEQIAQLRHRLVQVRPARPCCLLSGLTQSHSVGAATQPRSSATAAVPAAPLLRCGVPCLPLRLPFVPCTAVLVPAAHYA